MVPAHACARKTEGATKPGAVVRVVGLSPPSSGTSTWNGMAGLRGERQQPEH